MRRILTILAVLLLCRTVSAQEIRLGWGDPAFETLVFYNSTSPLTDMEAKSDTRYTGHFFVEGSYCFKEKLNAGLLVDMDNVSWKSMGLSHNCLNTSILATVRFNYFKKGLVELHSGLGAGLNINGGSDKGSSGHFTEFAPVLRLDYFGVTVGKDHWYGMVDLGGTFALQNKNRIYKVSARMISLSVAYRF